MKREESNSPSWWEWLNNHPAVKFLIEMTVFPLITGLVVGGVILLAENAREDTRMAQSRQIENIQAQRAERLENLRFVRDKSGSPQQDRPFNGLDLSTQSLANLKLEYADFTNANLSNSVLGQANLQNAQFQFADLRDTVANAADFKNANFTRSNLENASLELSTFDGACFYEANLNGAFIAKAQFQGAIFVGADLRNTHIKFHKYSVDDVNSSKLSPEKLWADFQEHVFYDESTTWPDGYEPAKSSNPPEEPYCGR